MSRAPSPPKYLRPPALAAWHRIYTRLVCRGEWDDLYTLTLGMTAEMCRTYLVAASAEGADPALVEEIRMQARDGLYKMHYIPASRVNFATLTDDGLDADIVAVCAPIEEVAP